MDEEKKIINNEAEFSDWFKLNFTQFGYSKIVLGDVGLYPDFVMLRDGKEVKVELETKTSNFILHKHDLNKVDEIVCINKDIILAKEIHIAKNLIFAPKERITITINNNLLTWIDNQTENGRFANRSHGIEYLIKREIERSKILNDLEQFEKR